MTEPTKPKRIGRPPSANPRGTALAIRVTPAEHDELRVAADKAGQPLTAFVRDKALAAARRQR